MARWISLLLLIGFSPTVLTLEWAEHVGPDAPFAVDVQETAPGETEGEEAAVGDPAEAAAPIQSAVLADASSLAGLPRPAPSLRPPR